MSKLTKLEEWLQNSAINISGTQPVYTPSSLVYTFNCSGVPRLSYLYLSWVWFYVNALCNEDTFQELSKSESSFRPWRYPVEDWYQWHPQTPFMRSHEGHSQWILYMDFWFKATFQNDLFYVKRTDDMGLGLFARETFTLNELTHQLYGFLEPVNPNEAWVKHVHSQFVSGGRCFILYGPFSLFNHSKFSLLAFNNLNDNGTTSQNLLESRFLTFTYRTVDIHGNPIERTEEVAEMEVQELQNDSSNTTQDIVEGVEESPFVDLDTISYYAIRLRVPRKCDQSATCVKDKQIFVQYARDLKDLFGRQIVEQTL
jgi:hypothetical protein